MKRFRLTVAELLLLVMLIAILLAMFVYLNQQITTRESVQAVVFSPNRKLLARASDLGATIFDLNTQRPVSTFAVGAVSIAFSPDSSVLATGEFDGSVQLWELGSSELRCSIQAHSDWISGIAFSPDSTRLYTASRDGSAKVWRLPKGELLTTFQAKIEEIEAMALSPNGSILALGGSAPSTTEHEIELWDTASGVLLRTLVGPEHCYVRSLSFAPNHRHLAVGLSVPTVRVWDTENGATLLSLPNANGNSVAAFSPSGQLLVTSVGGGAQLWNAATGAVVATLAGQNDEVLDVWFAEREQAVTTAASDGTVNTWNLNSLRPTSSIAGLSLRPHPVPWVALGGFGVWAIGWVVMTYKTGRRETTDIAANSVFGQRVVLLSASFFVFIGLAIVIALDNDADPIDLFSLCSLLSLLVLAYFGLLIANQRMRSRLILWLFAVALVVAQLGYTLTLLGEAIASV